jgi:hypothetical protein
LISKIVFQGVTADEQSAVSGFQKVKLTRFDSPENCAGGCLQQRGDFYRREHLHLGPAPLAPGVSTAPATNRYLLPRRHDDFGFRSLHGATALRFVTGAAPNDLKKLAPVGQSRHRTSSGGAAQNNRSRATFVVVRYLAALRLTTAHKK